MPHLHIKWQTGPGSHKQLKYLSRLYRDGCMAARLKSVTFVIAGKIMPHCQAPQTDRMALQPAIFQQGQASTTITSVKKPLLGKIRKFLSSLFDALNSAPGAVSKQVMRQRWSASFWQRTTHWCANISSARLSGRAMRWTLRIPTLRRCRCLKGKIRSAAHRYRDAGHGWNRTGAGGGKDRAQYPDMRSRSLPDLPRRGAENNKTPSAAELYPSLSTSGIWSSKWIGCLKSATRRGFENQRLRRAGRSTRQPVRVGA